MPKAYGATAAGRRVAAALGRVLENSAQQASNLKDEYVSTEHLLLAAALTRADGATARILQNAGITA